MHGKGGRRATVSDWMDMEKARGISITSAALQFVYRDHVVNLVDTPGHSDFSEDTYRVLSAVDSAVMLVDAGKGLEPQTLKLFKVCALRGIPVITVINKWDRPGPVGAGADGPDRAADQAAPDAADLAGRRGRRLPRRAGPSYGRVREVHPHRRRRHPRTRATDARVRGRRGRRARSGRPRSRSTSCCRPTTPTTTRSASWPGGRRPVMFASALQNFGVAQLLDLLLDLAPAPARDARRRRLGARGRRRLQRVRLQGAVRHERRAPRPARLRPRRVGRRSTAA